MRVALSKIGNEGLGLLGPGAVHLRPHKEMNSTTDNTDVDDLAGVRLLEYLNYKDGELKKFVTLPCA